MLFLMLYAITALVLFLPLGNEDIVDGDLKLTLGLIWRLIQRYSIFDDDNDIVIGPHQYFAKVQDGADSGDTAEPPKLQMTESPKTRLLNWIGNKIPNIGISNLTTDWNDGRAIGALVSAFAPGMQTRSLKSCYVCYLTMSYKFGLYNNYISLCM